MNTNRVADLTLDELRAIIREELVHAGLQPPPEETDDEVALYGDLSDFPEDDLGPWPENFDLTRDNLYSDD